MDRDVMFGMFLDWKHGKSLRLPEGYASKDKKIE